MKEGTGDLLCSRATRMVLSFWGIERSEEELGALLQSGEAGTGLYNIELLHGAGLSVTVWVGEMDGETLKERVDQGTPVIAQEEREAVYEAMVTLVRKRLEKAGSA